MSLSIYRINKSGQKAVSVLSDILRHVCTTSSAGRRFAQAFMFTCFLTIVLGAPPTSYGQVSKKPVDGKSLKGSLSTEDTVYHFSFAGAFDKILGSSASTDLYDPLTIQSLKRLKDEAQPRYEADDVEPDLTRRVAERALAIQSGRSFSSLIHNSELKGEYRTFLESLDSIQRLFRYSLQSTGDEFNLSRTPRGKKLIELNLEFNLKQGIDPQIRFGDRVRFRYDYVSQAPLLEYGFAF